MIRRYIPKESDISKLPAAYIKWVEDRINNKPRKILQYKTAYEMAMEHGIILDKCSDRGVNLGTRGLINNSCGTTSTAEETEAPVVEKTDQEKLLEKLIAQLVELQKLVAEKEAAANGTVVEEVVETGTAQTDADKVTKIQSAGVGAAQCSADIVMTQSMKRGYVDNQTYSTYQQKTITEVKLLQAHLNRLDLSSGTADGSFGSQTESAAKRLQEKLNAENNAGLDVDGIVGSYTINAINSSCK